MATDYPVTVIVVVALLSCRAKLDPVATHASQQTMSSSRDHLPSRADLLRNGGLYPVPVPLDWKLVGDEGEDVVVSGVPGDPFHRILALGALFATEVRPGQPADAMMLQQCTLSGPPSASVLDEYVQRVLAALAPLGVGPRVVSQQVATCELSPLPCGKVVIERTSVAGGQLEIRYIVRDRAAHSWELIYLLRRESLAAWLPLLAAIEGSAFREP